MYGISWLIAIALQACLVILVTRRLGVSAGLAIHVLLMSVFAGIGWFLLTQLATESITWRNHLASLLMPWPAIVGGGSILGYVLKNFIAAIVFAALVVAADRFNVFNFPGIASNLKGDRATSPLLNWATILCWIVLAVAWAWILQSMIGNQSNIISALLSSPSMAIPLLLPPIVVLVSIVLRHQGHVIAALLTVAIPMAIVLLPVLLMLAVVFYHYATGKPMRWN